MRSYEVTLNFFYFAIKKVLFLLLFTINSINRKTKRSQIAPATFRDARKKVFLNRRVRNKWFNFILCGFLTEG